MHDAAAPPEQAISSYYDSLSSIWHPVLVSSDLGTGTPIQIRLLGRDIVLARLGEKLVALRDLCRHFQARLSDGTIEVHDIGAASVDVLRCRYHGWAFKADGQCVHIPQLPDGRRPAQSARVDAYHVMEMHGLIWVALKPPRWSIPTFPECESDDMVPTPLAQGGIWRCSLPRLVLSAIDDYHFAWLHEGILGSRSDARPPNRVITQANGSLISDFTLKQPVNITNAASDNKQNSTDVSYRMQADTPSVFRIIKRGPSGVYVIFFFPSPIEYNSTKLFYRVARNYDTTAADSERILAFESFIQNMDAPIVSNQRPWLQDPYPISGADDALMAYRDWCSELGIPLTV